AAMLWVGAEIIAHGIPFTSHLLHDLELAFADLPALGWIIKALSSGVAGLFIGFVVAKVVTLVQKMMPEKK
ncbi:MAG TPA: hypothetical protein VGE06_14195, partial [Flavisolibacter sp.]